MVLVDGRVARRRAERRRPRLSVVGVLGELLITAGAFVLLFLGWQIWLNDIIVGNVQNHDAAALSESWEKADKGDRPEVAPPPAERADPGEPLVPVAPEGDDVAFANMIIPRFGADWIRQVATGVSVTGALADGIGHYTGTAMPGAVGNAAFAAHRTGWGQPFGDIGNFQIGDHIYLETPDGWYQYSVRSLEYVMPTGVEVLEPVPQYPGASPTDRIITLTSCNPKLTAAERIIVYGVYDTWYPRSEGAPAEIAGVAAQASAAG